MESMRQIRDCRAVFKAVVLCRLVSRPNQLNRIDAGWNIKQDVDSAYRPVGGVNPELMPGLCDDLIRIHEL